MNKANELKVIGSETAWSGRLTRREMAQLLLAGIGASAAWPLVAGSHPIYEHLKNDAILDEAEKLGAADWKPVFLDAQQNETLIALAEGTVPGSTKAQVNRFVDLLLSIDKPESRRNFVESLEAFDVESRKRFNKDFRALNDGDKDLILTDASEKQSTLHGHFENLKGWVSGAYYSSEVGMRELGWTGDYVFEKFPGCEHPEGHS
jgi:Gluconate 2-dehydrogenase subunit 3